MQRFRRRNPGNQAKFAIDSVLFVYNVRFRLTFLK